MLPPIYYISIHSLVKRETNKRAYDENPMHISIHSLVKRETDSFNCNIAIADISIHSLVKRETQMMQRGFLKSVRFQSTPS